VGPCAGLDDLPEDDDGGVEVTSFRLESNSFRVDVFGTEGSEGVHVESALVLDVHQFGVCQGESIGVCHLILSVVTELCHLLQTVLDVLLLSDDPSTLRSVEHIHFRVYVVESVFEILSVFDEDVADFGPDSFDVGLELLLLCLPRAHCVFQADETAPNLLQHAPNVPLHRVQVGAFACCADSSLTVCAVDEFVVVCCAEGAWRL